MGLEQEQNIQQCLTAHGACTQIAFFRETANLIGDPTIILEKFSNSKNVYWKNVPRQITQTDAEDSISLR